MRTLAKIQSGPTLYGTHVDGAPLTCVHIYVPDVRDIILGSVKTPPKPKAKESVQQTNLPLGAFLKMAIDGLPLAVDALFAPESAMLDPPSPIWEALVKDRHRFIAANAANVSKPFETALIVGGDTIPTIEAALAIVRAGRAELGDNAQVFQILKTVRLACANLPLMTIVSDPETGGHSWLIAGDGVPTNQPLASAETIFTRLRDNAQLAANPPADQIPALCAGIAAALSDAVRATELATTGKLTFPLANAEALRRLASEPFPYSEAPALIDAIAAAYRQATAAKSALPIAANKTAAEDFLYAVYRGEIVGELWTNFL
jgi:hypothetical protein